MDNPSTAGIPTPPKNAVLDDIDLQMGLAQVHPSFGDFCTRVAGEAWGKPLLEQRTKSMITIAIDVVNQGLTAESPFETHVRMALKQGVSVAELEELLYFLCVYAGFNKVAPAFVRLGQIAATLN